MKLPFAIQKIYNNIGQFGCGFFCLLNYFDYTVKDIYPLYVSLVEKGAMSEDCFLWWKSALETLDPKKRNWSAEISTELKPCTFYLEYWYNPRTKLHHFTLPDYDPEGVSTTKKEGYIESYRLFNCY